MRITRTNPKYAIVHPVNSDPIFIILNDEDKFEGFYKGDIKEVKLPKGWKFMKNVNKRRRFI